MLHVSPTCKHILLYVLLPVLQDFMPIYNLRIYFSVFFHRQISEARRAGDFELSKRLCDELNSLTSLRWDPTSVDADGQEWDVEEW